MLLEIVVRILVNRTIESQGKIALCHPYFLLCYKIPSFPEQHILKGLVTNPEIILNIPGNMTLE